jgi:hypothetical protein
MKRMTLSALLVSLPIGAFAQLQVQAPPTGSSGAIVKFTEDQATLKDKEGKEIVVAMTKGWTVSKARVADFAAIKPGDFVATANRVVNESTGKSTELRVLEPGYRPEYGTHLMSEQSNTAMTHGTVSKAAKTAVGVELDVEYPGGSRHLIVAPDIKITVSDLLSRNVLTPGTMVSAVLRKGADGVLRAGRLTLSQ